MFSQYKEIIDSGIASEAEQKEEFKQKRSELSLRIKEHVEAEVKIMTDEKLLQDYSPIKHANEMTRLTSEFNAINSGEQEKLKALKEEIDEKLRELIGYFDVMGVD